MPPPHPPTPSYILLLVRVLPIFSSQVWQIANSACVKHLKRDCYTEVTGILHIHEQARFLSVGWDKRITAFKDNPNVSQESV